MTEVFRRGVVYEYANGGFQQFFEQIKPAPDHDPGAGVFPVRLAAADWTSGDTNWLLDVMALHHAVATPALATSVLANMKQVIKDGDLRIHPIVTRLVEEGALEKLGASRREGTA